MFSKASSIYVILVVLLISLLVGAVGVSAQGPQTNQTSTPTLTATATKTTGAQPAQATTTATATKTTSAPTATKTTGAPTATQTKGSPAATVTKTSTPAATKAPPLTITTTVTATATVTRTATKAPATATRTPTKAPATVTRTPTKVAPRAPRSVSAGPTGTYASTIACVNMGSSAATLSLTFYPADSGTAALSYTDPSTLAVGSTRSYFTPSAPPGLPNPFVGSAVASSDQPLACTVITQRNDGGMGTTGTPARIAGAEGVGSGSTGTTLSVPFLFHGYSGSGYDWRSYISVQNTESSAMSVTVSYKDRFGVAYPSASETVNVPAQSNHIFYQEDNANLPAFFIGAATITNNTSGKMAAIVNTYNLASDNTTSQLQSYTGQASGAIKLRAPRFLRNFYGFNSGLSIQNIGGSSTTITTTFSFNGISYGPVVDTVAAGANKTYYAPNVTQLNPIDSIANNTRFGSAEVEAAPGGLIIANVNEDNRGSCIAPASCPAIPPSWIGWGQTYEAMLDGSQTYTIFFVQIPKHVGTPDFSGGFQVANTTGTAGTCDITYPDVPAANQLGVTLGANNSISRFLPDNANLPDGFNSSVKVVCTQPVLGIANFSARNSSYYGDTTMTVIGFNQ